MSLFSRLRQHILLALLMAVTISFVPDRIAVLALSSSSVKKSTTTQASSTITGRRFVILGGTGKIGTAVATHILSRIPCGSEIILVGRYEK